MQCTADCYAVLNELARTRKIILRWVITANLEIIIEKTSKAGHNCRDHFQVEEVGIPLSALNLVCRKAAIRRATER